MDINEAKALVKDKLPEKRYNHSLSSRNSSEISRDL